MFTQIRLKLHQFYKNNKNKIIIFLLILGIIFLINQYLKHYDFQKVPSTTYEPDTPIMTTAGESVPDKISEPIHALIEQYFNYCNEKNYEKAYNMLLNDCIEEMFPDIEDFKKHIDNIFFSKRVYTIQNYYNEDEKYVYRLRIFEDILATGLTGKDELGYQTEIITVHNTDDGMKLAINGYVEKQEMNTAVYEDENMKISVAEMKKEYEKETYTVKVYNKTEYQLILADHITKNEIELKLNAETRRMKNNTNSDIMVAPGKTKQFEFEFTKYYHEADISRAILFNYIRFTDYLPVTYNEEGEAQDIIEKYTVQLNMQ